jgi:hypothetical protein
MAALSRRATTQAERGGAAASKPWRKTGYRWITGPMTTVRNDLPSPEAPVVGRVGLTDGTWLSESSRSGAVVLETTHMALAGSETKRAVR